MFLKKIKNSIPDLPKDLQTNGALFKSGRQYSIAVTLDSIRHMTDEKGLAKTDIIDFLDRLADTIVDFDSVNFSYYYAKDGRKQPGIRFKKNFNDGTLISYDLVSKNKMSLSMKTLFMESTSYQKRKSAKTVLMSNSPAPTSKTSVGQTSNTNVPQNVPGVNTQSMQNGEKNSSSGQYSFLPPDIYQEDGEREAYLAEDRGTDNPSVSRSADTSLYTREAEQNGAIDENGAIKSVGTYLLRRHTLILR